MPPLCPLLMQSVVSRADFDAAVGHHLDAFVVGCKGSMCAWWDPEPGPRTSGPTSVTGRGRCGAAKGRNFTDPAMPEDEGEE